MVEYDYGRIEIEKDNVEIKLYAEDPDNSVDDSYIIDEEHIVNKLKEKYNDLFSKYANQF